MGIFKELLSEIRANADGVISDVGEDVQEIATGQKMSEMEKDNRWRAIQEQRQAAKQKGVAGVVGSFNQSFLKGYQQTRRIGMQIHSGRMLPAVPHMGAEKDDGMCGPGY